jgi:DNA-binding NtrC family response regulator
MQDVVAQAKRVALTNAAVLIVGESGTGKEWLARLIHQGSIRCGHPWVDVNCGALPDHLVESELFGHEKGAFSGADSGKQGLFELAHKGILFLDEVGELDPRAQVKLLRVLDGATYFRLGGVRKVTVDVRIVTATNRDLRLAVEAGQFRRDLYYRLAQFQIKVPPLRERVADILPLAQRFLSEHSDRATFSPASEAALEKYAWPGNVREVRNAVTHAVIMTKQLEIEPGDLPPEIGAPPMGNKETPGTHLDNLEKNAILEILTQTGGHQERAAQMLGISRRTLYRKLKNYSPDGAPSESIQ